MATKKTNKALVFFCVALFLACLGKNNPKSVKLNSENGKAKSVTFFHKGSIEGLKIHLANSDVPVLGKLSSERDRHTFTPVVPFSNHQEYQVFLEGKTIAKFKVELQETDQNPELLAIYPSCNTVPVNLLKMYFIFSKPMQHVGNPLDFVSVFDKTENSEVHPFLELEAELWNEDQTRLTLWLDPGRIKTDLIPNKEKGLPLQQGHRYTITVQEDWKSSEGLSLTGPYTKHFQVGTRDEKMPNPEEWTIIAPEKNTDTPLVIDFKKSMDAILALECLKIYNGNQLVNGDFDITQKDRTIKFHPKYSWKTGKHHIIINPILEDLAGNNLNHLFDTDLKSQNMNASRVSTSEKIIDFIVN